MVKTGDGPLNSLAISGNNGKRLHDVVTQWHKSGISGWFQSQHIPTIYANCSRLHFKRYRGNNLVISCYFHTAMRRGEFSGALQGEMCGSHIQELFLNIGAEIGCNFHRYVPNLGVDQFD